MNSEFQISGEHHGFLNAIAAAYYDTVNATPCFLDRDPADLRDPNRWTGWDLPFDRRQFRERFQQFIRSCFAHPENQSPRWRFKEIRYGRDSNEKVLPLLLECFPASRFVFLIRDPEATIFSMLSRWRFEGGLNVPPAEVDDAIMRLARMWASTYSWLSEFASRHPAECMFVRYKELHCGETYKSIAAFLNTSEPFDYASHLGSIKDASNKSGDAAMVIRDHISALHRQIDEITADVAALCFGKTRM